MATIVTNFEQRTPSEQGLKAVILDWAGTTVDFGSCAPVAAVMESFRSLEVPISQEQARAPMGKAKRDHIREILAMPEVAQSWRQQYAEEPHSDAAIDKVYDRFLPVQKEILPEFAQLIPGCLASINDCRQKGMKIGSSTGYTRDLMDILQPIAAKQGYAPDALLCAGDKYPDGQPIPGRPSPWMCLENARQLGVSPMSSIVKVDDTVVGIQAGLNAGMWTVGLACSGNLVGLGLDEFEGLSEQQRLSLGENARNQMLSHGAHCVVDTIADLPLALDAISQRLSAHSA